MSSIQIVIFIELADGIRTNGIVQGRGKARVLIHDSKGGKRKVMLENALYVPSYKQDIGRDRFESTASAGRRMLHASPIDLPGPIPEDPLPSSAKGGGRW